jgi:electron-transferring-flavoprotein dehydrogenase
MERVDVAIVGGGPAGMAAAREAATRGADVAVLEKGVPRADREELGPDSTDAAGMLDYWIDIMDFHPDELPEEAILQVLSRAEFVGPNESVVMESTGIEATYDELGFTFHRARMDDWLRERAEDAGADYRVGVGVTGVETDLSPSATHTVSLRDGENVEADYLVLADGPQRQVTTAALDQFMLEGESVADRIGPGTANHIAYQEHREFPSELFEKDAIKFWWGWMPGETAYPWIFPNDDTVGRVGLTMPMALDLDAVENREEFRLLRDEDETVPAGAVYLRRLLEEIYGDEYDIESDFPLVEDRGKRGGSEAYPISSTRPIESPTAANIAVAGGAMGTTSAFHEGGYHVAVRSGKIAGELAATDDLGEYNDAWKAAIGDEILRNVAFADIVADYGPADWDQAFKTARELIESGGGMRAVVGRNASAGLSGAKLFTQYKRRKFKFRKGKYVQLRESEYRV